MESTTNYIKLHELYSEGIVYLLKSNIDTIGFRKGYTYIIMRSREFVPVKELPEDIFAKLEGKEYRPFINFEEYQETAKNHEKQHTLAVEDIGSGDSYWYRDAWNDHSPQELMNQFCWADDKSRCAVKIED